MFEKEFERLIGIVEDSVKEPRFERIGSDTYLVQPDGEMKFVRHDPVYPQVKKVAGLEMFCELINREWPTRESFSREPEVMDAASTLYIEVCSYNRVTAYTGMFKDDEDDFMRLNLYEAVEGLMPGAPTMYMDYDEARIKLNACFMATPDRDYVLRMLSTIVRGDQAEIKDNGISQTVKVQTGIQMMGTETIRPIVSLKPYRTFPEVNQPESDFLLRVKDDQVGLFEADGGMWKLQAKENIKEYLELKLEDLIDDGKVVIGM